MMLLLDSRLEIQQQMMMATTVTNMHPLLLLIKSSFVQIFAKLCYHLLPFITTMATSQISSTSPPRSPRISVNSISRTLSSCS
jgi:hypothetical protein